MKVVVNKDNCIGCGACEAICPEVFALNDDGLSTVIKEEITSELEDNVKEAIEGCPTSAINEQ